MGLALVLEIRLVAGGLEKGLDLRPGNEDFTQHVAGSQLATGEQPADGFRADIKQESHLINVINQRLWIGRDRPAGDRCGHANSERTVRRVIHGYARLAVVVGVFRD